MGEHGPLAMLYLPANSTDSLPCHVPDVVLAVRMKYVRCKVQDGSFVFWGLGVYVTGATGGGSFETLEG